MDYCHAMSTASNKRQPSPPVGTIEYVLLTTIASMASLSYEGLHQLLRRVGVDGKLPVYPSADIQNSPMDLYRSFLADTLVNLTGCGQQVAYDSIQWPGDDADLMVVLPRLRLPKSDWNELGEQLKQQVCGPYSAG